MISEQSILIDSDSSVYTSEGSTVNLSLKDIGHKIYCRFNRKTIYSNEDSGMFRKNKYNVVLSPEFQMINVTTDDTGIYRLHDRGLLSELYLQVTSKFMYTLIRVI